MRNIKAIYLDKELLIEKSKNVNSISSFLLSIGLSNKGNNYRTLKKYITLYNIDTTHFNGQKLAAEKLSSYNREGKIPILNLLVENSSFSRSALKKRLIEEKVLPYVCSVCLNTGFWQEGELVLQLEHKNGISTDNRKENLCFLCPNCHSQTLTYAGKANKTKNYCLLCNKQTKNKFCSRKCSLSFNRDKIAFSHRKVINRPSKESLLEDLLKSNFTLTAKKYGVCDNSIRKWLLYYGLNKEEIKNIKKIYD